MPRERKFSLPDSGSMMVLARCLSGRRLEILRSLTAGEKSLGQLAREIGVHRGYLTETINLLQSQELVRVERRGRSKVPRLTVDRIVIQLREAV